jgi:hypothetical protein
VHSPRDMCMRECKREKVMAEKISELLHQAPSQLPPRPTLCSLVDYS